MPKLLFFVGFTLAPITLTLLWTTPVGLRVFETIRLPGFQGWTIEYVPIIVAALVAEVAAYAAFRGTRQTLLFVACSIMNGAFGIFHLFVIWYFWGEKRLG